MGVRSCISRASRTVLGSDDLDELFAYSTIRMTVIRDRRLGLLNLFFKGAIVVYVVMQLWWQGSYLEELAVRGSGRFALHQPTSNCTWDERQAPSTSPYCATCDVTDTQSSHCFDVFPNVTDLPYCTQSELFFKKDKKLCRFEEAAVSSTVFQSSLLAATQGTELRQKKVCSANPSDPLYNDGVCNRVYETVDNDVFFFAFIDNFTVSVYHSLQYPQQVTNEEMEGALLVKEDPFNKTNSDIICADDPDATDRFPGGHPTNVSPCWIRPDRSEDGSDLFQLNTFLKAAATKLDHDTIGPNITVRTMGTTLIVGVEYENWAPWEVMTKQAPARYKYFITPMYNNSFQNTEAIYDQYPDTRTLLLRNGVRLVAVQSGMLRNFSFANLLITLATSLTLLAITTTIVDLISTSVMTDSNLYKDYKVQYTPDVSDVRAGLACATCASETYRIITTKENPGYCGICEGDFVENTVMYRCVKCDHLRCKACLPRSTSNKPATINIVQLALEIYDKHKKGYLTYDEYVQMELDCGDCEGQTVYSRDVIDRSRYDESYFPDIIRMCSPEDRKQWRSRLLRKKHSLADHTMIPVNGVAAKSDAGESIPLVEKPHYH